MRKTPLLLGSFFLLTSLHASASSSTIEHFMGEVEIIRNSKKIPVRKGTPVLSKDKIRTGNKDSLAIVLLADQSRIKLGPQTEILATQLTKKNILLRLKRGQIFSKVKRNKRRPFVIRARNATLGVRGTQFFTALGEREDVWMCVRSGKVDVSTYQNQKRFAKETVSTGQGVSIRKNHQISSPKSLPWTRKLNWNMEPKQGEVINRVPIQEAYQDLLNQDYD